MLKPTIDTLNYWAPLTNQVEALDNNKTNKKKVRFVLPMTHKDTDGWQYRQQVATQRRNKRMPHKNASMKRKRRPQGKGISLHGLKRGIMDGTVPSACADTGATSSAGTPTDPFKTCGIKSTKVFSMPTGTKAPATEPKELLLDVDVPANEVHIVPNLEQT